MPQIRTWRKGVILKEEVIEMRETLALVSKDYRETYPKKDSSILSSKNFFLAWASLRKNVTKVWAAPLALLCQ